MKSQKAVEPLIQLLKNKDSYVRVASVEALGKIKSQKAVGAIIKVLKYEKYIDYLLHMEAQEFFKKKE